MHLAQNYISTRIFPTHSGKSLLLYVMTPTDAALLEDALRADALSYIYSAIVSLSDAMRGVQQGYYTWATVKMYYTAFYALRSLLALRKICIFYDGSSPRLAEATAGTVPQKLDGNTHKCVINIFSRRYPGDVLLSQQIDSEEPLNWLMRKREAANYNNARFYEPAQPDHFVKLVKNGARSSFVSYFGDNIDLHTFDKDHSIVAFPLRCLRVAASEAGHAGVKMSSSDISYLGSTFKDSAGPLPPIINFIQSLG